MITPIKLTRPQRRQLAEQGVDFLKIISKVTGGKKEAEDVTMQEMMEVLDMKTVDLIVDMAYPDKTEILDDMADMDLIQLAIQTYMLSFSGADVAGKS